MGSPPPWSSWEPLGIAGAALVLANRRISGALLAAASIAGVLDEAENGPRVVRRVLRRRRTTVNVVARVGHPGADRTLVVLAHHDAAQTGRVFDQTLQRRLSERFPGLLRRVKTQPPIWWIGVAGPLAALVGAAGGRRAAAGAGVAFGGLATGVVADVMRSPTVPGANDNLSGVALPSRSPSCCATARSPACGWCSSPPGPKRPSRTGSADSWHATGASSIQIAPGCSTSTRSARRD